MTKIRTWLRDNFWAILQGSLGISIIVIVIWIAILDVKDDASSKEVQEATLAILALIGGSLLVSQRKLEEISKQQLRCNLSEVFFPFGERIPERAKRLKQADVVWILSRTCRRLWSDYRDELQIVAKRGGLRLLFLDPNNGALDMIAKSAIWQQPGDGERLKDDVRLFIKRLRKTRKDENLSKFAVQLIDYLPAWTLILIDPGKKDGVIYVEFATYRSHPLTRPSFIVERDVNGVLFDRFLNEFKQMWCDAQPAWEEISLDSHRD